MVWNFQEELKKSEPNLVNRSTVDFFLGMRGQKDLVKYFEFNKKDQLVGVKPGSPSNALELFEKYVRTGQF